MQINEQLAAFEELAKAYNLPIITDEQKAESLSKEQISYLCLRDRLIARNKGEYKTIPEIIADFSALDSATMLKQLNNTNTGFSLIVKGITQEYTSPILIEELKQNLTASLLKKVEKLNDLGSGQNVMLLKKGYGGGWTGRGFIIECEQTEPQVEGFSIEELNAIISFEKKMKAYWEKTQGNKHKDRLNYNAPKTKLPELGAEAEEIIKLLPTNWKEVDKYNLIADYMHLAGFLDFKGMDWLSNFQYKSREDKKRMVKDWIKSWENIKK